MVKIAKRMGVNNKNLNELYQNDCINMVDKIIKDTHHPIYNCYVCLRRGRRPNAAYESFQDLGLF